MARDSRTRYTILGCLSIRPMSGYDVKQFIDRSITHFWRESYGQIYPALRSLAEEGLIEEMTGDPEGRSRRRVYAITDSGLRTLREWLLEPPIPDVPRYEMSLKLFFGEQMPVEAAIRHVERYREQQERQLELFREYEADIETNLAGHPRRPFWIVVLRGGQHYSEMAIRWCDENLERLRSLDPEPYPLDPPGREPPVAAESD